MHYNDYLNQLIENQNIGADKTQKNLYTKEQYEKLLKNVLEVLNKNKDANIDELRNELYKKSGIEDLLKDFFCIKKMAPGAVISYGTKTFQEQLVIGNREETILDEGTFIPSQKEMNSDTIFDLASCTKLFTAISTLKLVEEGKMDLLEDVTEYAPQFENLKGITIFDLLTFEPLETKTRIDKAKDKKEAEEILFTTSKKEIPYGANKYNDFAPMVLKYVIESASGMSYYEYLSKNILNNLGMYNTFVKIPNENLENVANSNYDGRYYKDGNYLIRTTSPVGISTDDKARILGQPQGILSGHAGLFSNSSDMTKLARALIDNKIINFNTRDYMAKNRCGFHFVTDDGKDKYSQYLAMLCYSKHPLPNSGEVHHSLSGKSFAIAGWSGTQLTVDPINNINFSLLSNRSHNRMTFIDSNQKEKIITNGKQKTIILPNGKEMIDSTRYAWDRDEIIHKCIDLAFQYKMLEDITGYEKENTKQTSIRKIK